MKLRTVFVCLIASFALEAQSVTPPTPATLTSSYLNTNKMHYATGGWQASVVYNSQDLVTYLGASYISLIRGNLNHSPLGGLPWWDVLAGGGGGGNSPVSSIFGRIGTINAQTGDYNAAQITNAVSTLGSYSNPTWLTGLDWTKVANKPTFNYQAIQYGGTPQQQRAFLNFGSAFLVSDNSIGNVTTVDVASVLNSSITGNAATASAFLTTPGQAATNKFCTGINAAGGCNDAFVNWAQIQARPTFYFQNLAVGSSTQTQHARLNLIQGANVTLSAVDNGATDSVDVTIDATGGGGSPGYSTISNGGNSLTQRTQVNFGAEFIGADNSGAGRTDITVNQIDASKIVGLAASATTNALDLSNAAAGRLALARGGTVSDLSATGGAHFVLQQPSAGQAITVGQLAAGDISGLATSATTDATNAANIASGTLAVARLPQFTGGNVTTASTGTGLLTIGNLQILNGMIAAGTIDLTAKVTGITPSANGGTANAFTAIAGPAGTVKTYTVPNVTTTLVTISDTGSVSNGMLAATAVTTTKAPSGSLQGSGTKFLTAGTVSATPGTPYCTADAAGTATTSGCSVGAGTVTVSGSPTVNALVTMQGATAIQTPNAGATLDSATGNVATVGTVQAGAGGTTAGAWAGVQGTATAAPVASVGFQAPTSVTSAFRFTLPGSPAAGLMRATNAAPSVISVSPVTSTEVVAAFNTGTCSGYLKSNGLCDVPGGTGTVTTSGSPAANQVAYFSGATAVTGTATDTAPTHALFTSAGAPGFRALAAGDLPGTLTSGTAITNAALTTASVTTSIADSATGTATVGVAAHPFGSLFLGNAATNNIKLTGTSAAARIVTIPDVGTNTGATVVLSPTSTTVTNVLHATATAGLYSIGNLVTADLPTALQNDSTSNTQAADDNGTHVATTAYVDRLVMRQIYWTFGDEGNASALTTASRSVNYVASFACAIAGWSIAVGPGDSGTATFTVWKIAAGTAIPTVTNIINTSGVALSSGTTVRSTTVSDFTTTAVSVGDVLTVVPTAIATMKAVTFGLECKQ